MNRFEQQKRRAFIAILWVTTLSTLTVISLAVSHVTQTKLNLILIGFIVVINVLFVRWANTKWFSMPKAFYRIDPQWRFYSGRERDLQDEIIALRKNPTLIDEKMEKYGYTDPKLFTTHLLEEVELAKKKRDELDLLLKEINITPQKTLIQYARAWFGI